MRSSLFFENGSDDRVFKLTTLVTEAQKLGLVFDMTGMSFVDFVVKN